MDESNQSVIDSIKKAWAEQVLELIKDKTPSEEILIETLCKSVCGFKRGYTINDILAEVRAGQPLGVQIINFLSEERTKTLLAMRDFVPPKTSSV